MDKGFFIWLVALFLAGSSFCQEGSYKTLGETWREANHALQHNQLDQALYLYNQVLVSCKETENLLGEVNALEAIALVYKKKHYFITAAKYCRKAVQSGSPTFRSYYMLAQMAFEDGQQYAEAIRYCNEGLKKFPGNTDLLVYRDMLKNSQPKGSPRVQYKKNKANANSFKKIELDILRELNTARSNPAAYAHHLKELKKYYEGELLKIPGKVPVRTMEGLKAVDEAIEYLENTHPVPTLKLSSGMSRAALDHVLDQGPAGTTGHTGIDGSEPYHRLERYGEWQGISGENIAYGDDTARMIVTQLIIDDGVASRGHRQNIFMPDFKVTGIAVGPHSVYGTMCVITFTTAYKEKQTHEQFGKN